MRGWDVRRVIHPSATRRHIVQGTHVVALDELESAYAARVYLSEYSGITSWEIERAFVLGAQFVHG